MSDEMRHNFQPLRLLRGAGCVQRRTYHPAVLLYRTQRMGEGVVL